MIVGRGGLFEAFPLFAMMSTITMTYLLEN